MYRPFCLTVLALLFIWAGPARAETFAVDGVSLDLPAPDGFCFVTGIVPDDPRNVDIARRQPPADSVIAMVEPCGENAGSTTMSYGRWLLRLDNGVPRRLAAGSTRSLALGQSIQGMPIVTTGIVYQMGFLSPNLTSGVIGGDGTANYRALVYPVSMPFGGSLTQAGIEGETVLLGRPVAFQLFDTYQDLDTYAPLERQVKAVMTRAVLQDPTGAAPREAVAPDAVKRRYSPRLEAVEVAWLLAKALAIAAAVFGVSAYVFRGKSNT